MTAPSWQFQTIPVHSGAEKLLVRGDCDGGVVLWRLMDLTQQQLRQLTSVTPVQPLVTKVTLHTSLQQVWAALDPPPVGQFCYLNISVAELGGVERDSCLI